MRVLVVLGIVCLCYGVQGGVNPERRASVSNTRLLSQLSAANSKFSLSLYNKFTAQNKNLIISPFSVFTALAMTSLGARGTTHDEIFQALNVQSLGEDVHQAFHYYTTLLQGLTNVTMNNANGMFVKPGTQLLPEFSSKMKNFYDATAEPFDFSYPGGPEVPINAWVSNQTAGMIKDFLAPGSVDGNTVMWLINAIYFKGTWQHVFDERVTRKQPFHVDANTKVDVDMMSIDETMFNYKRLDNLKTTVLELPYVGGRYSMFILLPDAVDGLADLESGLDATSLDDALQNMNERDIFKVSLPKIKIESSLKLGVILKTFGINQLFNSRTADLSGMTGRYDLYVDDAIQKAVVHVTEEGTTAAAATGIMVVGKSMFFGMHLTVNHPYMFVIRDRASGVNVFHGRVSDPTA